MVRTELVEEIQSHDPLIHSMIPMRQRQPASHDFLGEHSRCGLSRRRLDPLRCNNEIAKFQDILGMHPPVDRIKRDTHLLSEIVWKKFTQPILFDSSSERQDCIHFALPSA